jgi:uncharacterized cofD-like protein
MVTADPKVVAVGGGHGLAATIRAVRRYAGRTTAIVTTADDGGSTGRLRSGLTLPAPGDLRRCLAAMADPYQAEAGGGAAGPLAAALEYRFTGTDIEGHALGNLLLAGLAEATGDFVEAVDEVGRLLGLDPAEARVLPATAEPVVLRAWTGDGREIEGQVTVSGARDLVRVGVRPADACAPPAAVKALLDADQVVLGPGSLFTSVLAAVAVDDVRQAIEASGARRVYVCNLRAEVTESAGYDVAAHVRSLRRHGVEPDVVVAQRDGLPVGDPGVDVVEADVARPNGLAHDSARLAEVLGGLVA